MAGKMASSDAVRRMPGIGVLVRVYYPIEQGGLGWELGRVSGCFSPHGSKASKGEPFFRVAYPPPQEPDAPQHRWYEQPDDVSVERGAWKLEPVVVALPSCAQGKRKAAAVVEPSQRRPKHAAAPAAAVAAGSEADTATAAALRLRPWLCAGEGSITARERLLELGIRMSSAPGCHWSRMQGKTLGESVCHSGGGSWECLAPRWIHLDAAGRSCNDARKAFAQLGREHALSPNRDGRPVVITSSTIATRYRRAARTGAGGQVIPARFLGRGRKVVLLFPFADRCGLRSCLIIAADAPAVGFCAPT